MLPLLLLPDLNRKLFFKNHFLKKIRQIVLAEDALDLGIMIFSEKLCLKIFEKIDSTRKFDHLDHEIGKKLPKIFKSDEKIIFLRRGHFRPPPNREMALPAKKTSLTFDPLT